MPTAGNSPPLAAEVDDLLDALDEAFIALDGEGRLLTANQGALALLGAAPGDRAALRGRAVHEAFPTLAGGGWEGALAGDGEAVAPGRMELTLPLTGQRVGLRVLPRPGGRWLFLRAAELSSTVSDLTLAERLASLGTLAGGVAHEINNPLTYITANLGFLQEQVGRLQQQQALAPGLLEELRDAVDESLEGAHRVERIVRDLRTFCESGAQGMEPLDLKAIVQSALSLAGLGLSHKARVRVDLQPTPTVVGNPWRLGQVFLNLLSNASRAVVPPAEGREPEISIRSGTDSLGRAFVEVEDTGVGIPAPKLPHVFDPFFTTQPTGRGLGLGLFVCHGIVREHGGEISVASEPGRGSRFRVVLPPRPASAG